MLIQLDADFSAAQVLSSPAPYFSYYLYDLEQGVYALQLQALNAMGASSLSAPSGEVVVPECASFSQGKTTRFQISDPYP